MQIGAGEEGWTLTDPLTRVYRNGTFSKQVVCIPRVVPFLVLDRIVSNRSQWDPSFAGQVVVGHTANGIVRKQVFHLTAPPCASDVVQARYFLYLNLVYDPFLVAKSVFRTSRVYWEISKI
jgi:hypothetical protein